MTKLSGIGDLKGILNLRERGDKSEEKNLTRRGPGPAGVDAERREPEEKVFPILSRGCRLAGRKIGDRHTSLTGMKFCSESDFPEF
jgi:hypothetical protein